MTTPSVTLGYEQRRETLERFVDEHYIAEFKLRPCRMLDLGCGDGFWADIFERQGFTVVGIDRDIDAIEVARSRRDAQQMDDGPVYLVLDFDDTEQLAAIADGVRQSRLRRGRGDLGLVFARTLPHFYAIDLTGARDLVARMLEYLCDPTTRILLSIYSDESDTTNADGQHHHKLVDLTAAVSEAGAAITKTARAGGYLQIACQRP